MIIQNSNLASFSVGSSLYFLNPKHLVCYHEEHKNLLTYSEQLLVWLILTDSCFVRSSVSLAVIGTEYCIWYSRF